MLSAVIIYVASDLVTLFVVPKLPTSTFLHHVTTTTLFAIISAINLKVKRWDGLLCVTVY